MIERVRQRQEPIVITQRGGDVPVFLPVELYRKMESLMAHRIASPRLTNPEDAAKFRMEMTLVEPEEN